MGNFCAEHQWYDYLDTYHRKYQWSLRRCWCCSSWCCGCWCCGCWCCTCCSCWCVSVEDKLYTRVFVKCATLRIPVNWYKRNKSLCMICHSIHRKKTTPFFFICHNNHCCMFLHFIINHFSHSIN